MIHDPDLTKEIAALRADLRRLTAEPEAYVTIEDFLKMARISRSTLDRLRKRRPSGFPKEYRPSSRPLFKRSEVHAWVEAQPLW